jgi:hypothetical protein
MIFRITGATGEAIDAGREALAIASELGDTALAATATFFLGTAHQMRGELAACRAWSSVKSASSPGSPGVMALWARNCRDIEARVLQFKDP